MRVRFGNRIYICTVATHTKNSKLILITTDNGIYTVSMKSVAEAERCHTLLLTNGHYDFSECEYHN